MDAKLSAKSLNLSCPYAMQEELDAVRKVSFGLRENHSVVMIGCGPAVFALSILEDRKHGPDMWIIDINKDMFDYASAHLEAANIDPLLRDGVVFVHGDSSQIGLTWTEPVNFLIVDGDHSYEGVKADLKAWLPHVPRKSMIFLHDFLERPGGFDGIAAWSEGGCARAVGESIAAGEMMPVRVVGIGILCERL